MHKSQMSIYLSKLKGLLNKQLNKDKLNGIYRVHMKLKPGLHVSRKDRKHRLENMFFKLSIWSPCGSNDRKY